MNLFIINSGVRLEHKNVIKKKSSAFLGIWCQFVVNCHFLAFIVDVGVCEGTRGLDPWFILKLFDVVLIVAKFLFFESELVNWSSFIFLIVQTWLYNVSPDYIMYFEGLLTLCRSKSCTTQYI